MVETMLDRLQRQMREQFPQALSDMANYGMYITKDGERIAPEDFYIEPPLVDDICPCRVCRSDMAKILPCEREEKTK